MEKFVRKRMVSSTAKRKNVLQYDFGLGKGRLKKNFDFRILLNTGALNKKFVCSRIIHVDDETVERVINSKKYMVKGIIQNGNVVKNLSEEFADKVGLKYRDQNFIEDDTSAIFAIKNKVNGEDVVELCMIKTIRSNNMVSVSLYYLPNGVPYNACMIARYCWHRTNEHNNRLDGKTVHEGQVHLHKYSEEFYNSVMNDSTLKDKEKLKKLQSPDAEIIEMKPVNMRELPQQIINSAMKGFNVEYGKEVEAYSDIKQKRDMYYDTRTNTFHNGESNKTLVDTMAEEMNL